MSKVIRAEITYTLEFDENGFLEWEKESSLFDGERFPRTEAEMIDYAREEMYEVLMNGAKYNDIWNMIDVVVVND